MWQQEAPSQFDLAYADFLSLDISMLRLFETFLERTPQLTLVLAIVLQSGRAEYYQCEYRPGRGAPLCVRRFPREIGNASLFREDCSEDRSTSSVRQVWVPFQKHIPTLAVGDWTQDSTLLSVFPSIKWTRHTILPPGTDDGSRGDANTRCLVHNRD